MFKHQKSAYNFFKLGSQVALRTNTLRWILGKCIEGVAGQILMLNNDKYDIGASLHTEGSPHVISQWLPQ